MVDNFNSVINDDEQRLVNIRKAIGEFSPTAREIEENMRLIDENKAKIRQLYLKVPGETYIQLHHPKHKDFIDLVKKLHDINKNLDQYKSARESQSLDLPRLQAFLQQQETIFRESFHAVKELEILIDKLESVIRGENNVLITKKFNL